jgi:hypothetical protein
MLLDKDVAEAAAAAEVGPDLLPEVTLFVFVCKLGLRLCGEKLRMLANGPATGNEVRFFSNDVVPGEEGRLPPAAMTAPTAPAPDPASMPPVLYRSLGVIDLSISSPSTPRTPS